MFIGIDGTGSRDAHTYAADMHDGFIRQLVVTFRGIGSNARYFRGPTLLGTEVDAIAAAVLEHIRPVLRRDPTIVLAGYSRGGAAAIRVAQLLRRAAWASGHTIACMALFDAVDRDVWTDTAVIPGNVRHAYHAMRDRAAGSRLAFGNCGTRIELPGRLETRTFFATHAGMGGVPWTGDQPVQQTAALSAPDAMGRRHELPKCRTATALITREQDIRGSSAVRQWMWAHLARHRS